MTYLYPYLNPSTVIAVFFSIVKWYLTDLCGPLCSDGLLIYVQRASEPRIQAVKVQFTHDNAASVATDLYVSARFDLRPKVSVWTK